MAANDRIRKRYRKFDSAVWNWALNEKNVNGEYPLKKQIQSFALTLYKDAGEDSFKASASWYHRWRKRCGLIRTEKNRERFERSSSNASKKWHSQQAAVETRDVEGAKDKLCSPRKSVHEKTEGNSNFRKRINKKHCKYDQDFKNEVIRSCDKSEILTAAAKYKVHPNTISIWLKDDQFRKRLTKGTGCREKLEKTTGKKCENEARKAEEEFMNWFRENEKHDVDLSKSDVSEKINSLYSSDWSREPHWFAKYCQRFVEGKKSPGLRIHYSEEFQTLLVNYASRTSQLKTASAFNVSRKQLFNWMKNSNDSDNNEANSKKRNNAELLKWYKSQEQKPDSRVIREKARKLFIGDSKPCFSYSWYYKWCSKHGILVNQKFDDKIIEWILLAYDQNLNITHPDVRKKASEIYQKHWKGSFKASAGWLLQFCRRYMDLIRRTPSLSVSLPSSYENEILSFRNKLSRIICENNVPPESFGIMDEIPLKLKPSGPLNKQEERKPLLRSCGFNDAQGSIIVGCLSSGFILPPVITLRDKSMNTLSGKYHVLYRQGDILDENIIHYWLDNVWFRHVKKPNLLLLDCFAPHNSVSIGNKFTQHNSFVEIIPGGCSSKLNPLTQIISSQLQDAIDTFCKKWYHENRVLWLGGNISLSSGDILDWIIKAFQHVDETCTSVRSLRRLGPDSQTNL